MQKVVAFVGAIGISAHNLGQANIGLSNHEASDFGFVYQTNCQVTNKSFFGLMRNEQHGTEVFPCETFPYAS